MMQRTILTVGFQFPIFVVAPSIFLIGVFRFYFYYFIISDFRPCIGMVLCRRPARGATSKFPEKCEFSKKEIQQVNTLCQVQF
jgi:hypothetical protein